MTPVVLAANGAGKTTLLKALMGVVPVKSVTIHLDGRDITRDNPFERARKGVSYTMPQGREIDRLTVEKTCAWAGLTRRATPTIPEPLLSCSRCFRKMLGRRGDLRRPAAATGDRARAGRRALAADPDEPTEASSPASSGTSAA